LIDELCEMRLLVEDYGLRKLMEPKALIRHRPQLEELRAETEQLRSPDTFDVARFLKTDITLHQLLLQAPGNQLMTERHQFIYAMIQFQLQNAQFTIERAQLGITQHLQILDAIFSGNESAALAHLQTHLISAQKTLHALVNEPASGRGG
jgi:DNA-binding FadR family transcriptional regulator